MMWTIKIISINFVIPYMYIGEMDKKMEISILNTSLKIKFLKLPSLKKQINY